jgi:hypothetical protein
VSVARGTSDARALAQRIAAAIGIASGRSGDAYVGIAEGDAAVLLSIHGDALHLVTEGMCLRFAYGPTVFSASLVRFPPDDPPRQQPTSADLRILRRIDDATDGLVGFGARNAADAALTAWLSACEGA